MMLILVLIIGIIVYFVGPFRTSEDVITQWASAVTRQGECVILRDEQVVVSDSTVRIEYVATENTVVSAGDTIAYFYTTGYSESLLTRLETTRSNIQTYHRQLLGTIVDNNLDRLETIISLSAQDFKGMATLQNRGNLRTIIEQLQTSMVDRQEYLRANKRDDVRLTKLYDEENTRLSSIRSWRKESNAKTGGVVSFYLDGYETDLSANNIDDITIADLEAARNGVQLGSTKSILTGGMYRIVDQDNWAVALTITSGTWNPVVGQTYYLTFEGYEDLMYTGTVTDVRKSSGTVMAVFSMQEPIGPLIYKRTAGVTLSISLSSLAVHTRSIARVNDQDGIWLYDVPGGTFVPVDILSVDGSMALIQPRVEGALQAGQRVLIK
ncbi:MAG: hypothetical protein MJ099_00765 [Clostridia bacterium]|nr:hypothetical protein [Clostridia bacterium]